MNPTIDNIMHLAARYAVTYPNGDESLDEEHGKARQALRAAIELALGQGEQLTIKPPNAEGSTHCIIRWMAETQAGWVGSWDRKALEQFNAPQPQPKQEPVTDWVALNKQADQIVRSKPLWKKYIDGTPLANDIACWMADFALSQYPMPKDDPEPVEEKRDLLYATVAMQEREDQRIENIVGTLERIKQEKLAALELREALQEILPTLEDQRVPQRILATIQKALAATQAPQPKPMPPWITYDAATDVLTIHGKRYSTAMFGEDGFLAPPGTLLRIERGPTDVVTVTTVQPQRDDTALLREENIKLRGWLNEEAQAAGSLQRQVHKDTALLRQALEALDCIYSPLHVREIEKVGAAMAALKERLK